MSKPISNALLFNCDQWLCRARSHADSCYAALRGDDQPVALAHAKEVERFARKLVKALTRKPTKKQ